MIKIISLIFLYKSNQFQNFIKDTKDYSKIEPKFDSNIELAVRYQLTFHHVSLNNPDEAYISESLDYFKSTLSRIVSFLQICRKNSENYENFARSQTEVYDKLNEVGKTLINQEKTVALREECINPYAIIKDWAQNEIYELRGILKAIKTRKKILKIKSKISDSADELSIALNKANSGKKSIIQRMGSKNEEDIKNNAQKAFNEKMHELEMIVLTEKIITCRLSKIEIPFFRKNKTFQFNSIMKAFITANLEEFNNLIDQSKRISYIHSK